MIRRGGRATSTQWDREEHRRNTDDLLGCVLLLLTHCNYEKTCAVTQNCEGYDHQGLRSSGVKVWVTSSGKSPRPAEVIAEDVPREFKMETGGGSGGRLVMVLRSIAVMRAVVHPLTLLF